MIAPNVLAAPVVARHRADNPANPAPQKRRTLPREVVGRSAQRFDAFGGQTDQDIARVAQEAANDACVMVVVDAQLAHSVADRAPTALALEEQIEFLGLHSIPEPEPIPPTVATGLLRVGRALAPPLIRDRQAIRSLPFRDLGAAFGASTVVLARIGALAVLAVRPPAIPSQRIGVERLQRLGGAAC